MDQESLVKLILIPGLWLVFKKSKSLPIKPLLKWDLDPRKHGHKLTPVRISTDNMFAITLYAPVLLISTIELIISKRCDLAYTSRYCIGFLTSGIMTSVIKIIVSRPRPNAMAYEEDMKDRASGNHKKAHIARQSFLSGHAFGGVFASTFTSLFLMKKFPQMPASLTGILFLSGLYPGLTQAIDHWHHETDVLAGYTFGLATSLLSFCIA